MSTLPKRACRLFLIVIVFLISAAPDLKAAGRELHWATLDVDAHLQSDGVLDVIERHTIVFTGDWNGGERVFNVRPGQQLEFIGIQRIDTSTGAAQSLNETSTPRNIDEFAWTDSHTLRWRSRLPSDPPFASTPLTYVLHYKLSGILRNDGDQYRINHDFAFPSRAGTIERFTLKLDLDPAWQPMGSFNGRYSAGPIEPGRSFVLNIPMHYSGAGAPVAIDTRRPLQNTLAAIGLPLIFALLVAAYFKYEGSRGRFDPTDPVGIDDAWIRSNILKYPAEVVGAAWDGRIGTPEVVALISRMTAEGKLTSRVSGPKSMSLVLNVGRDKLNGYEKTLIDGLFFEGRTETSTEDIQKYYKGSGFAPATVISPELRRQALAILPPGEIRTPKWPAFFLFVLGILLLAGWALQDPRRGIVAVPVLFGALFLLGFLQIPGLVYRSQIEWGRRAAAILLIPASLGIVGVASVLWWYPVLGFGALPWMVVGAISAFAIGIAYSSINAMKFRVSPEAIALRKSMAKCRNFFRRELEKPKPELRDEWYPWMLAFGLGKQIDVWSSHYGAAASSFEHSYSSSSGTSGSGSMNTGFRGGGGFSGGGGATGAWAAAATGMAVGVAAPGSSDSGGSSGSSSSGSSSGGGGGGGW